MSGAVVHICTKYEVSIFNPVARSTVQMPPALMITMQDRQIMITWAHLLSHQMSQKVGKKEFRQKNSLKKNCKKNISAKKFVKKNSAKNLFTVYRLQ